MNLSLSFHTWFENKWRALTIVRPFIIRFFSSPLLNSEQSLDNGDLKLFYNGFLKFCERLDSKLQQIQLEKYEYCQRFRIRLM